MGSDSDGSVVSRSAIYAALSGSGSALFGLYRSEADAKAAQQRVQSSGVEALLTETLPRAEYWEQCSQSDLAGSDSKIELSPAIYWAID